MYVTCMSSILLQYLLDLESVNKKNYYMKGGGGGDFTCLSVCVSKSSQKS